MWRGVHLKSKESVALKVVSKASATKSQLKYAKNEAKILKRLEHPNIIKLIDFFESEEEIVLVLPLYQCTLEEYLELRSTNISEIEALEIFRKVSLAIDYAHR